MGWIALGTAATGLLCAVLPNPGMFFAMGLGIFAVASGWLCFRRRTSPSHARLAGAGAVTLGLLSLALGVTRYGLTLAALRRIENLL